MLYKTHGSPGHGASSAPVWASGRVQRVPGAMGCLGASAALSTSHAAASHKSAAQSAAAWVCEHDSGATDSPRAKPHACVVKSAALRLVAGCRSQVVGRRAHTRMPARTRVRPLVRAGPPMLFLCRSLCRIGARG